MLKYNDIDDRTLVFMKSYQKRYGYMPSIREIKDALEIGSTSTVKTIMSRMISNHQIETDHPGCPRAYRLVS